jgi:hypothetical protein
MSQILKFSALNLNICKWFQIFFVSNIIGCRTLIWSICKKNHFIYISRSSIKLKILKFTSLNLNIFNLSKSQFLFHHWVLLIFLNSGVYCLLYLVMHTFSYNVYKIKHVVVNFDVVRKVVRKNLSDGKTLYTKVIENLVTNLRQEESSETKL